MKRSISFRPTLLALVLATNFPVAHAAVPKDMLVIGKAADPQTLDPAVTIDNNDWTVTYHKYFPAAEGLMTGWIHQRTLPAFICSMRCLKATVKSSSMRCNISSYRH